MIEIDGWIFARCIKYMIMNAQRCTKQISPLIICRGAAKNAFYLKKIGVTHVLNTAEGNKVGRVDTSENFYYPYGIKYKGLKLCDVAQTNIALHFSDVADYIDEALSLGGKHICNCFNITKATFLT